MTDLPDRLQDEIELIDYLRVIWKWKYLILVGTVVCALVAAVISISKPKIYRVETILQPGVTDFSETGQEIYVPSPTDIKILIETGIFNNEIIQHLENSGTRNTPTTLQFKVEIPANTNLLKISYETSRVDAGISILNQLIQLIPKEQPDKVNYFKTKYEKEILENEAKLSRLQGEIHFYKEEINYISKRLSDLATEVKSLDSNISIVTKHRDRFVNNSDENALLTGILYSSTIQQSSFLRNQINNQILDYNFEKERAKSSSKGIQSEIYILSKKIEDLKQKRDKINNIQVVQPPTKSPYPIKPRVRRNLMLASTVGLFLMLFLAFFLEYISKYKSSHGR